ncbi:MAG: hypothetical protein AAGA40_18220 [Cyanobacteria bacterium P01_E01_bin.45]
MSTPVFVSTTAKVFASPPVQRAERHTHLNELSTIGSPIHDSQETIHRVQ